MISEIVNTLLLTYVASEYVVATYNDGNDFVFSGQHNNYTNVFLSSPSKNHHNKKKTTTMTTMKKSTSLIVIICAVILVNILDHHVVGVSSLVGQGLDVLEYFSYVVRFVLAATSYIITLFVDINRRYFFGGVQYVGGGDSNAGGGGSTSSSSEEDHHDDGDEDDDAETRQQERTQSSRRKQKQKRRRRRRHYHGLVLPCRAFLPRVGRSFVRVLPAYPFLAVLISFVFMFVISIWEFFKLPERWLQWPIYYGTLYGPFVYVYCTVKRQILCTDGYTLPS